MTWVDVVVAVVIVVFAYGWWRTRSAEAPDEIRRKKEKYERQFIADTEAMGLAVRRRGAEGGRGWEWQIYDPTDPDEQERR